MLTQNNSLNHLIGGALLCLGFVFTPPTLAACNVPHYRKAVVYENSQSSTLMQISIKLNDFAPKRLACLVQALKETYPGRNTIGVSIFSSFNSAKHYRIISGDIVGSAAHDWGREMHADYYYDLAKGVEYLEILPFGAHSSLGTKIDMSKGSIPLCRLQIGGRCLLSADSPEYPPGAAVAQVSGIIAMNGTITPEGKVKTIRIAHATPEAIKMVGVLENAAAVNLKSWRFEPATHELPFRINYVFEISQPGTSLVEFELPERVIIHAKP